MNKICIICNKEFTPNSANQKCCCKECSEQLKKQRYKENYVHKQRQPKTCLICNKEFVPTNNGQKFCCKECKEIFYNNKKQTEYQSKTQTKICTRCKQEFQTTKSTQKLCPNCIEGKPFTKICEYCGKEFETTTNKFKYCSDLCNSRAFAKRHKVTLPPVICPICKQEFIPTRINQTICNSEKCKRQQAQNYLNERYKNNPEFRLANILRTNLRRCLSLCYDTQKKDHTFTILGYTPNDLKQHLEKQFKKGMNWGNQGTYWEIDHIKEIDTFNFILPNGETDYEQIKLANSLENLQPLTIEEHRKKSVEYMKLKHL